MAKKVNKKSSLIKKFLLGLLIFFILAASGIFLIYNKLLGDINSVDITDNEEELEISTDLNNDIINIALFGIDTREDDYDSSRADTIMIASIDSVHKKLKLTSIMRDTFVNIPGKKYDKINHSYAYGGPELAIKTINQNFDMNIKDYVTVNFGAMEKIVDAVGGVEIDVKKNEIRSVEVSSAGLQILNGKQAVNYCRIRKVGNGDYERTDRQRIVLQNVVKKVLKNKSLAQALSLVDAMTPYIETSLSKGEIVGLATTVFTSGMSEMVDIRLPLDDYLKGGTWGGVYYLKPKTLIDNVIYLHNFIYEEESYVPTSVVTEISAEIAK